MAFRSGCTWIALPDSAPLANQPSQLAEAIRHRFGSVHAAGEYDRRETHQPTHPRPPPSTTNFDRISCDPPRTYRNRPALRPSLIEGMTLRAKLRRCHAQTLSKGMRKGGVIAESHASRNLGDIKLQALAQQRTSVEVTPGKLNVLRRQSRCPRDRASQSAIRPAEPPGERCEAACRRTPHH